MGYLGDKKLLLMLKGDTPYIGDNGNWWIGTTDTGVYASGGGGGTGSSGEDGATFIPSVDDKGNLSWTNDKELENPTTVNIKGKDGANGLTPFIGSNGNWWIGATDTGVKARVDDDPNAKDYTALKNKPTINNKEVDGDLTLKDIGVEDYVKEALDNFEIPSAEINEETLVLKSDLYTYVDIGNITGVNKSVGEKVADKGKTLKDVFTAVFGTKQDTDPTISDQTKVQETQSTTLFGGGEVGTTVNSTTATYKIQLSNTGSASYGYKCIDGQTYNSSTFYYPIKKQNGADVKITLPTLPDGITKDDIKATIGSIVSSDSNILYCDFSNKVLEISITLPSDKVSNSQKTRFGAISYEIQFENARKTENNSDTEITNFLTYLGENYTNGASKLTHNTETGSSNAWVISKGSYYNYAFADGETVNENTKRTIDDRTTTGTYKVTTTFGQYAWILTRSSITSIKSNNIEMFDEFELKSSDQTITNSQGEKVSGYKAYRTKATLSAGTWEFEVV